MKTSEVVAQERGITQLPPAIFAMCLKIPRRGLPVLSWQAKAIGSETHYAMPEGIDEFGNTSYENCVGYYGTNNGRIAFVDNKGDSYVSPHMQEVEEMLIASGYEDKGLGVYMSNGEEIVDPELASQWDALCQSVSIRM